MFSNVWIKLGLAALALPLLVVNVTAHEHLSPEELAQYNQNKKREGDALAKCLASPQMHEHNARELVRRQETLLTFRDAHGIESELVERGDGDRDKYVAKQHGESPGHSRDPQKIFGFHWGDPLKFPAAGCSLIPSSTYGPYWHEGQSRRQDIRAGKRGIYLRLAMQVIDVSKCLPLGNAQVDVWHADAMGNYSPTMDGYLRGWQPTSDQGTVDFDTNFPGHYGGRASHIHVAVRVPRQKRVAGFGMIYFDQELRDEVERTDQYKNNQQTLTSNKDDDFIPYDSTSTHDPIVHWSRLGRSLEDGGVLAWITFGVNTNDPNMAQPPNQKRDIDWHLD